MVTRRRMWSKQSVPDAMGCKESACRQRTHTRINEIETVPTTGHKPQSGMPVW